MHSYRRLLTHINRVHGSNAISFIEHDRMEPAGGVVIIVARDIDHFNIIIDVLNRHPKKFILVIAPHGVPDHPGWNFVHQPQLDTSPD